MIMPPGKHLLLPANPFFVWGSLVMAILGNMLLNMGGMGRAAWVPDLLALTLVFWNVHQPLRVGIGAAFVFGLLMDVQQTTLLGQHALAYVVLSYWAVSIHRRLLWFPVSTQTAHVLPLFALAQVLVMAVRFMGGAGWPAWSSLLAPVCTAALWPLATAVLLAPQRRPPDPDKHRPL
jgi:rod shape-determining protein MreD